MDMKAYIESLQEENLTRLKAEGYSKGCGQKHDGFTCTHHKDEKHYAAGNFGLVKSWTK